MYWVCLIEQCSEVLESTVMSQQEFAAPSVPIVIGALRAAPVIVIGDVRLEGSVLHLASIETSLAVMVRNGGTHGEILSAVELETDCIVPEEGVRIDQEISRATDNADCAASVTCIGILKCQSSQNNIRLSVVAKQSRAGRHFNRCRAHICPHRCPNIDGSIGLVGEKRPRH